MTITSSYETTFAWLQSSGFIEDIRDCPVGSSEMKLNKDRQRLDQYIYISYDHNNQNRANRQIWAFGIYHRQSKQIVVQIVNDRTRETLEAIIQRYCRQGSEIHSDGWASYAHLDELGYVHREIIKYGTNRNRNRRGRDFRRIRGSRKNHK